MLGMVGCKGKTDYTKLPAYTENGSRINNSNDTIEYYNQTLCETEIYAPGDTIHDAVAEGYPDTIKVAFTRDGVFEDSIEVVRTGDEGYGYKYIYVLRCVVGDAFYYTRDGKFLDFVCVDLPHSGQGHHDYKP